MIIQAISRGLLWFDRRTSRVQFGAYYSLHDRITLVAVIARDLLKNILEWECGGYNAFLSHLLSTCSRYIQKSILLACTKRIMASNYRDVESIRNVP